MRSYPFRRAHGGLIRGAFVATVAAVASLLALAAPAYADHGDHGRHSAAAIAESYRTSLARVPGGFGAMVDAITANAPGVGVDNGREVLVRPYLANLAVPKLVAAGPRYFPIAKAYLSWYLNHLQWPDPLGLYGTVCDYRVNPATGAETYADAHGKAADACYYGSAGGYAGTFLVAVKAYAQANPADAAWVARWSYELEVVSSVIEATKQSDGLTWAKPNWHTKYLTNNVEAQKGLEALSWLERNAIGDTWNADYAAGEANIIATGIETHLKVPTIGMYANDTDLAAACASGAACPDWRKWRPAVQDDATALDKARPLWAHLNSVTSQELWSEFIHH